MRIGISTASFYPDITTEESLEVMKKLGFNICEAFLESDYETSSGYALSLLEKSKNLDIEIYSVHAFSPTFEPFLFDKYERRRLEMEKKFKSVCKAANILGAKYYTFHGMKNTKGKDDYKEIGKKLDYLCNIAKEYDVNLCLENVSRCKGGNLEFLSNIEKYMDNQLNYTLDLKQARRNNKSPFEYLNIYKNNIKNVHINDSLNESLCLLPGAGNDNLKELISSIYKLDKNIPYIIEVYRDNYKTFDEIINSRKYLESLEVK